MKDRLGTLVIGIFLIFVTVVIVAGFVKTGAGWAGILCFPFVIYGISALVYATTGKEFPKFLYGPN